MPRPAETPESGSSSDPQRRQAPSLSLTGEELSLRSPAAEPQKNHDQRTPPSVQVEPQAPAVDTAALAEAKRRLKSVEERSFRSDVLVTKRGRSLRMLLPGSMGMLLPNRGQLVWLALLAAGLWTTFNWRRPVQVGASEREFLVERSEVQAVLPDPMLDYGQEQWGGERHLLGGLHYSYSFGSSADEPVLRTEADICRSEARGTKCFRKRSTVDVMVDWGLGRNDMSDWENATGLVVLDEERPLGDESRVFRVQTQEATHGYGAVVRVGERVLYVQLKCSQANDEGFFELIETALGELRAHRP